jgi:hypothetical protein
MLSDDVAVALAPARSYARLAAESSGLPWWRALERPLLVLLVIGTGAAIAATGRVTVSLVLSTMLLWLWAVAVQAAAGAFVMASCRRRVAWPAAIDLLFAGHVPWSIWIVVVSAWHAADLPYGIVVLAAGAVVTIAWNAVILNAWAVAVLGASPSGARVRVLLHQTAIWGLGLWFIASISGGWFRLLEP